MWNISTGQPVKFMLSFVSAPKAGEYAMRVSVFNAGPPPKPKAVLTHNKESGLSLVFVDGHPCASHATYDTREPSRPLYYCTFRPAICPISIPGTFAHVYRDGMLRGGKLHIGHIDFSTMTPRPVVHHERGRKRHTKPTEPKPEAQPMTQPPNHADQSPQENPHHGVNIPVSILPTLVNSITDAVVKITMRGGVIVGLTFEELER